MIDRIRAPQNFFKHAPANCDPDETLEFYYESTQFLLLDTVYLCWQLTGRNVVEFSALFLWAIGKHPHLIIDDGSPLIAQAKKSLEGFNCDDFEAVANTIDFLNRQNKGT